MTAENALTTLYLHLKGNPRVENSTIDTGSPTLETSVLELYEPGAVEEATAFIKECLGKHWPHSIDVGSEEMQEPQYADFDVPALRLDDLNLTGDWRYVLTLHGRETVELPSAFVMLFEKEGDKYRVLDWIREDVKSRA